ncbi:MAG: helix-turn-helix domain-containing protein [Nitrospirae bacterium]|nr:MAG: helix-turn-helix domain-containing protein [Nitrospirota bacterium]
MMFNDAILTIDDVAAFLKIPKSSVYKLIHEAGLPAHRVGKHFRLVQGEVTEWLKQGGLVSTTSSERIREQALV